MHSSAKWLERVVSKDKVKKTVALAKRRIRSKAVEFDTIVFCGVSGALFGPVLAYEMKKEIVVVRKQETERSHSYHKCEGYTGSKRFLIVDDIIDSGSTMRYALQAMKNFSPDAECVGAYLYAESDGTCGTSPKGFLTFEKLTKKCAL